MLTISNRRTQWGRLLIFFIAGLLAGKFIYSPDLTPVVHAETYVIPTDSEIRDDVNRMFVEMNIYDPVTLSSEEPVQPIPTMDEYTRLFIESIIQIESQGKPRMVGGSGERGLMQIMPETWRETTQAVFGKELEFDYAFNPTINKKVGSAYVKWLQHFLHSHQEYWGGDVRELILACYNCGPGLVKTRDFELSDLPESTQSYVERGINLHECLLAEEKQKKIASIPLRM